MAISRLNVDIAGANITPLAIVHTNSRRSVRIAEARTTHQVTVPMVASRRNVNAAVARITPPWIALMIYSPPNVFFVEVKSMRRVIARIECSSDIE